MIALYSIMLAVFISYVSFIWIKYGIQTSISNSYYILPDNLKPLMTLFCWGFAIPAMIIGSCAFMFFAGAGIVIVGVNAAFEETFSKTAHELGAVAGVIFAQLAIGYNFNMWPINLAFVLVFALLFSFKVKNKIWWTEIAAFLSICIAFGIKLIK